MKLPAYVKVARAEGKSALNSWKQYGFPTDDTHVTYLAKRREYRQKLRKFLNQSETDRIKDLCNAANSNENLFWKHIKGQRSSSQMSAFLVCGKLITDKNAIRNMWADHFKFLGNHRRMQISIAIFLPGFPVPLKSCLFPLLTTPVAP